VIEQLIYLIKSKQAELQVSLAQGIPGSWESYRQMVGEHQGLQDALDLIDQILEEQDNR
jgi:hypothetical protein